ncbi:hypothetical protein BKA69DRAFT_1043992 [Paraphysoderma sedebokerense]|nr:hypothetical protein BKA69DRAFT_1043992 [Paraphysoderma sedebokerense]
MLRTLISSSYTSISIFLAQSNAPLCDIINDNNRTLSRCASAPVHQTLLLKRTRPIRYINFPQNPIFTSLPLSRLLESQSDMFTIDEFSSYVTEFESPNFAEWDYLAESNGLKMYRKPKEGSTVNMYKCIGVIDSVDHETAFSVYMDLEYRRKWDNYKEEHLQIISGGAKKEKENENEVSETKLNMLEKIYWRMKYPMFMSDREYVFHREARALKDSYGQTCYVILAKSDDSNSHAPSNGVVRVDSYHQVVVFSPGPDPLSQTSIYMSGFDDPKIESIPSSLLNLVLYTSIPNFIKNFRAACKKYNGELNLSITDDKGVQELKDCLDNSLKSAFVL